MSAGVAQSARNGGGRRRLAGVLLFLVLVAAALRVALSYFSADLFAHLVARAASQAGVVVAFDEAPAVSSSGFEARGVAVNTTSGVQLLRAGSVTGGARFMFGPPWMTLSLRLAGADISWPQVIAAFGAASSSVVPSLPSRVSGLRLENAHVDLGEGRSLLVDAAIAGNEGGSLDVSATRVDYSESQGERAAERLAGTLRLGSSAGQGAAESGLRVEVGIGSGAMLLGAVLLDFAAHPLTASAVVSSDDRAGTRWSELALTFGSIVRLSGRMDFDDNGAWTGADLLASSDDLMPTFVALVRDPFGGVIPALAEASVEGRGSLALRFESPSRHAADATLTLKLVRLRTRALEAGSVDAEVPWIGASLPGRPPREGHLRAATFTFAGLPWTGLDAPLKASAGRLRAGRAQQWKTSGGTLHVTDLAVEDDVRAGPRLSASLRVEGFDLAGIGKAYGVNGLEGTLRGNLGRVLVDADSLRADGGIEVKAFGGKVEVSGLVVEQPFARVPTFGLDAKVSEVDLDALTKAFGVGRITGVLEGQVGGLRIADGQVQAFDADLHSVERKGVSQKVDVRAIVQLGVLGGGDSGSITGTLLRIVDRYRYAKLGVRARLRNDVFELRGVETDHGKDYIVKGSLLPPSVSVVSHSQVISFSEMLRRLQRITATSEGGSPNAASP